MNEHIQDIQNQNKGIDEFEFKRRELWEKRISIEKEFHLGEGDEFKQFNWIGTFRTKGISLFLKCVGLYKRGQMNASKIKLNKVKFVYPDIPKELHGFKILFISDFHLSQHFLSWLISGKSVIQQIKIPVDLILLGGDYRFGYFGSEDFVIPLIKEMLMGIETKYGIYGVMGNHDISSIREKFEESNIHILVNEGIEINHNGAKLWLGGVDVYHGFECADVASALVHAPKDAFKIMLSHSPELIEESLLWDVQLYLCGHTHGGQIGLPFIGPIYVNAKCKRKFAQGKWEYRSMQGYTSTGLGVTDVPVRFNAEAEVVILDIVKIPFSLK